MQKIKILLYDIINDKKFFKHFETEYERDKFVARLKYSKKLMLLNDYKDYID